MADEYIERWMDDRNPAGILNLLEKSTPLYHELKTIDHDILGWPDLKLLKHFYSTETDFALRLNFWNEICKVKASTTPMQIKIADVIKDVCGPAYFERKCQNKYFIAWLVRPVRTYERTLEALLMKGMSRFDEILSMDITSIVKLGGSEGVLRDKDGNPMREIDPAKARVFLAAIKEVQDRVKGTPVARILSKNETTTINLTEEKKAFLGKDEMNARIKLLEAKVKERDALDAGRDNS